MEVVSLMRQDNLVEIPAIPLSLQRMRLNRTDFTTVIIEPD